MISSVAGDRGRSSNFVYGAAKGALSIFLSGLRAKLSKNNIHIITIKPGFIGTPMTAHLKQGPLFVSADCVAKSILKGIKRKKDVVYAPWFWFWIMLIIKHIPEKIFKKMSI